MLSHIHDGEDIEDCPFPENIGIFTVETGGSFFRPLGSLCITIGLSRKVEQDTYVSYLVQSTTSNDSLKGLSPTVVWELAALMTKLLAKENLFDGHAEGVERIQQKLRSIG